MTARSSYRLVVIETDRLLHVDAARRVRPLVLRQMIAAHELLAAVVASEPLLASVRASMTLQLVTPCEPLRAVLPITGERLVSSMTAKMSPQMGRLSVGLLADMADVQSLSSITTRCIGVLAVGTRTGASLRNLAITHVSHFVLLHHAGTLCSAAHPRRHTRVDRSHRHVTAAATATGGRLASTAVVRDDPLLWIIGILLEMQVAQGDSLLVG